MGYSSRRKRRRHFSARTKAIALASLVVVTLGAVIFGMVREQATIRANAEAAANFTPSPRPIPTFEQAPLLMVIGDSMSAGANNEATWPELVADEYGMRLKMLASGGSAYTQEAKPFIDQAKDVPLLSPAAIIVAGSVNDRASSNEEIAKAAGELYAYLGEEFPGSEVFVVGPISSSASPLEGVPAANAAIEAAAQDAGLIFWDPLGEEWLPDKSLIQEDNLHPTDEGQQQLAEQLGSKLLDAGAVTKPTD